MPVGTSAILADLPRKRVCSGCVRFTEVSLRNPDGAEAVPFCGGGVEIRLGLDAKEPLNALELAVSVKSANGQTLSSFPTRLTGVPRKMPAGSFSARLLIPRLPVPRGVYDLAVSAKEQGVLADFLAIALRFPVEDGDFFGTGRNAGGGFAGNVVLCDHNWAFG